MNRDSLEILAKLKTAIAISDAQVMANPLKYLKEAEERLNEHKMIFDKLLFALSPDLIHSICEKGDIAPQDFNGEALARCNAALDILNDYFKG